VDTTGPPQARAPRWTLAFWLLVAVVVAGLFQLAGSPLSLPIGSAFVPAAFALLVVIARAGDTHPPARVLGLMLLWATLTALGLGSLALVTLHVVEPGSLNDAGREIAFRPGGEARLSFMMALLATTASLAVLGLFRAVRAAVCDIIPVDPGLYSHAVGLAMAVAVTLIPLLPLFVLGRPPFPVPADALPAGGAGAELPTASERAAELAWFAAATLVAAGPGSGRRWTALRARLGLTAPPLAHAGGAAAAGLTLAWLRPRVSAALEGWAAGGASLPPPDAWLPDGLSPAAAIVLALLTATGTEITYRGFLQPRLGIVLANLLLTAQLAWASGWSTLFVVFGIGLVFGLLRSASGTLTALVAHIAFLLGARWLA
jgi:hypothetical protein